MEGEENEKTRLSSCQDQLKTFILTQMDSYHAEAKIAALRDMEDTNTRTRAAGRQQEQQQPDLWRMAALMACVAWCLMCVYYIHEKEEERNPRRKHMDFFAFLENATWQNTWNMTGAQT